MNAACVRLVAASTSAAWCSRSSASASSAPAPARALTGVGVVMVGAAIAMRAARAKRATKAIGRRPSACCSRSTPSAPSPSRSTCAVGSVVVGCCGKPLERDWPKLATRWRRCGRRLVFSALPIILGEFGYATVARAPRLEIARIRDAVWSGVGLAGALVFAFALCYVGAERDKKVDLSYFRTAKPGESTRKIVQTMDQPIQVSLFFPPANEVREEVAGYFDDLKKESKLLEVNSYDRDVDPQKAKELGVSGNGIVVVARGGAREQMSVGPRARGRARAAAQPRSRRAEAPAQGGAAGAHRLLRQRARRAHASIPSVTPTSARPSATCASC